MENKLEIDDQDNPDKILEKMRNIQLDIAEKVDQLLDKAGIQKKEFMSYFSNPSNFTPEEWSKMEKYKENFLENVWKRMGKHFKKNYEKQLLKKSEKAKKHKSLGNRKNWIQMR